jgi:outer membrane protein assembly factor BamB/tetratricopeptide (TPR) repeat protein
MALRGDLASVDLAQVFQMLALNKKVGLLSIQSTKLWKVLYFDHRGVTVHHNVHRILDRVVAAHVRTGRLTEAQIDEVRDHAARMAQPLADSLLAGGYLEPAELEDQYRIELDEEIYDLFFVRDAKFEFHEGATTLEGREGTIDERFFSNCDSVIMEAARRIDEWTYITERVPTTGEVLVAIVDAIDADQFGPDGTAIFEQLDGRRNVARVVEITGLSTFQVCKVLSQLLEAEAIAPVASEELVPLADECMTTARLQDAINLYERAIELGLGLPEAHSSAAKAYHAAEEYEHAIYHLGCEAEWRLANGDRAGAAQRLFEVRAMVPTDLRARERLVELTLGEGAVPLAGFDPLAEGKELVDLLIEFGDIARVRTLLERLLMVEPDDPDLKKALVNVHVKAGDQKRVAELYESIAADLVQAQKPLEAVAYLQKILLIDRSRTDISERVRKLYEFDERSRRRGRTLAVLAVLFCLLLVLGSGYWFYNERAEEEFARIDVRESLQREDFAAAQMAYDEFVASHPLTTAVGKANAELQHIEAERQRFEARRASERAERNRELKQIRDEYRAEWARHREQFLGGKAEESLATLAKVRTLLGKAGGPDDMAWGLEQQVDRTFTRLTEYLAEAQRLGADYDAKLQAGDWRAARTLALRLRSDFEHTEAGHRCRIPVQVSTRPAGARLFAGDQPLTRQIDGRTEPVVTPAVVLGDQSAKVALVARLEGFEPRPIEVEADKVAEFEGVLEVVAVGRLDFDAPAQTGVSLAEGWIAVGLRGGRLGLARVDGSSKHVRALSGLKAVDSTPVVQGGRVFFTSNENTIECMALDTTAGVGAWPVSVPSGFATEPMVAEGRVAVIDRDGVLHCWEQSSGQKVWSVSLDSAPSGPPTIDRRQIQIGTADGRVLAFDAVSGASVASLRCPSGLSTRVLRDRGVVWFGASDGNLRAVETGSGRVLWTVGIGRTPLDGQIALGATTVLVVDGSGALLALDRTTGKELGRTRLDGTPLAGLRVQGNRALLQVRRAKVRNKPSHDVLLAVDTSSMTLLWEYAQAGNGPGPAGSDDFAVALPTTTGEVVLFR